MSGDRPPPRDPAIRGDPVAPHDGEQRPNKEVDVSASTVTNDFMFLFRKNYYFPNDVKTMVPRMSDRANLPPAGYVTVSEAHLRAGLRFPPPTELIEVLQWCGVSIFQLSFRAMSVAMGLIALFRDRGATMTPEHLSRMGKFTSDTSGRVTFRSKLLDVRTRDSSKNWVNAFFFVKNDWGLIEKWGKMRDLPSPLHVSEEDIIRILKVSDLEHLLFEVRHMSKYTEEEFLFKVGISFHTGRSDARKLKPTSRIPEPPAPTSKAAPKRPARVDDPPISKKKRLEGTNTDKTLPDSSPAKIHIPDDVMNHQCLGHNKTSNLLSRAVIAVNDWNTEFVKIKYLQGEFKRKYDQKVKEVKVLEDELSECRTELANSMRSVTLRNQQADRHQIDLEEAHATITRLLRERKVSEEKIASLETKDRESQAIIAEKEAALSSSEPSRVIEDFKKSIAFKTIVQDRVEEARDHIYAIEVKGLEQQCTEDGFIRGFFKGVRLMQRKTGVPAEEVTPSQASADFPSGSDGDEVESDLRKVLDLDADDEIVDVE
ncbi:hypothetical protein KFK09_005729 [Dendrobium nobile]|uniref:Uncharacterized protein n=1 Tax=Dendrobium nobile TaxID=94219 RepID=A0A8T3BWJ3_DENNO|nr:hypothetical protein KFK09_005729 [Dendrobium nobile]